MSPTLAIMCSLTFLMFIAVGVFLLARKLKFPYTVLLVVVGLLLIPLSRFEPLAFLGAFRLTPDVLFYVFLPPLIFESAYNMHVRRVMENVRSITLLSVVSLMVSALLIAALLYLLFDWIGFPVPFIVTMLFGALISATDPVAVLALFKEYGAPKRLTLLFEGESIFNDGTAVALFLVVLGVALEGWHGTTSVISGAAAFVGMVVGGAVWGTMVGFGFSRLLKIVKKDEYLEITLTMVIAHFTFISAELMGKGFHAMGLEFHLSAIIATTVAAMIVGNSGRYQLTPRVAEYMERFWGYFAFVANSLVFILIGLLFADIAIDPALIVAPTIVAVLVVIIARAVSIYPVVGVLNWWGKEEPIPLTWQHLLSWGSLRGALAITMVLLIPADFTVQGWNYAFGVRDFLIGLTVACMYFTLFIKATTIGPLIRKLHIDALSRLEVAEHDEAQALLYAKVLREIERFHDKRYITDNMHRELRSRYETSFRNACARCAELGGVSESFLMLYATGYEKHSLKTLHQYEEVSERVHKAILADLGERQHHLEEGKIVSLTLEIASPTRLRGRPDDVYMYYRARMITARKALEELQKLSDSSLLFDEGVIGKIVALYGQIENESRGLMEQTATENTDIASVLQRIFAEAGIRKAEDRILEDLSDKEIVSSKVASMLRGELAQVVS